MQVVVLAGGRGERLDPLTAHRPKPLLPVLGRPMLGRLLDDLAVQPCVDEVLVTTGYLGSLIADYVDALPQTVRVRTVRESEPRGTAGAVVDLLPQLRSPFAVVSGDALVELDLQAMLEAHTALRAAATLCVAPAGERLRFGIVRVGGGRVAGFLEKPRMVEVMPSGFISTGCYVLSTDAMHGLPASGPVDFARDVFPRLMSQGRPVAAVEAATTWSDLGTLESFRDAHLDAVRRGMPGVPTRDVPPVWARSLGVVAEGPIHVGPRCRIGAGAHLVGPLYIGADCTVGARARVERSVLLDGCRLEPDAWLRDSVVDGGASVSGGCAIRSAIVGCPPALGHPATSAPAGASAVVCPAEVEIPSDAA
jgi:mannose-1-phosphate guanylyltransferase/phosphomannomutase